MKIARIYPSGSACYLLFLMLTMVIYLRLLLRTFCCFTALFPNNTVLRLFSSSFSFKNVHSCVVKRMFELFGQSPVCDTVVLDRMSCIFLCWIASILELEIVVSQVLSNCCWNLSRARHVRCVRAHCHLLVSDESKVDRLMCLL